MIAAAHALRIVEDERDPEIKRAAAALRAARSEAMAALEVGRDSEGGARDLVEGWESS